MRIVSWNMNHARRSPAKRSAAWSYIREELRADIALIQEASPPATLNSVYRPLDARVPQYRWGSAVVALRPDLILKARKRVPLDQTLMGGLGAEELPDSHPGACAVADVCNPDGRHLVTAVSLYGQWEVLPGRKSMYACSRMHRMLSDLTGVLASARRRPTVLAGDLNLTTQTAVSTAKAESEGAAAVFARLHAWQMVGCIAQSRGSRPAIATCRCLDGAACSHTRTYRHNNREDSYPTQLDYAFASGAMVAKLHERTVIDAADAWDLATTHRSSLSLNSAALRDQRLESHAA